MLLIGNIENIIKNLVSQINHEEVGSSFYDHKKYDNVREEVFQDLFGKAYHW